MPPLLSFIDRLREQLQNIEREMVEFLDTVNIGHGLRDHQIGLPGFSGHVSGIPSFPGQREYYHFWYRLSHDQNRVLMRLKQSFESWVERFTLLTAKTGGQKSDDIRRAANSLPWWFREENSTLPPTNEQAKEQFREDIAIFYEVLQFIESSDSRDLVIVPDTNAIIAAPDPAQYAAVVGAPGFNFILVPTVLAELDKLKVVHRDNTFRSKVEGVINRIKGWRTQGSLLQGVTVNKTITVKMIAVEPNFEDTLRWLDATNQDDRIIASVLELQCDQPSAKVILVTSDINLQNKAEMANLPFVEPPP